MGDWARGFVSHASTCSEYFRVHERFTGWGSGISEAGIRDFRRKRGGGRRGGGGGGEARLGIKIMNGKRDSYDFTISRRVFKINFP